MVRWVVGSILHGGLIELFHVPASAMTGIAKGSGICYSVSGIVHLKDRLLLIEKSSPCNGGSGFRISLSEWSFTICLTPYNRK